MVVRDGVHGPVSKAAAEGELLDLLAAQRMRIAQVFDDPATPPRDLAALSRQLLIIAERIDALTSEKAEQVAVIVEDERWDGSAI